MTTQAATATDRDHTTEEQRPPGWLAPLLDDEDLVSGTGVSAVRAAFAAAGIPSPEDDPTPADRAVSTYFAMTPRYDPNEVLSFHALTAAPGRARGAWWTFVVDRWRSDESAAFADADGRLRWVPPRFVASVEAQIPIAHRNRHRPDRGVDDDVLRYRLARALRNGSTGSVDLAHGYVQWAGYPGGLHLEVGDGRDYTEPLDPELWRALRWLGWLPPDAEERNAWFEAEGPDAVDVALDLVSRTLTALRRAQPRAPRAPHAPAPPAEPTQDGAAKPAGLRGLRASDLPIPDVVVHTTERREALMAALAEYVARHSSSAPVGGCYGAEDLEDDEDDEDLEDDE